MKAGHYKSQLIQADTGGIRQVADERLARTVSVAAINGPPLALPSFNRAGNFLPGAVVINAAHDEVCQFRSVARASESDISD